MLDVIELNFELDSLNLTCLTMGEEWLLIHRPQFDVFVEEEPFQTLQVIVNLRNRKYLLRLWGQTFRRGSVKSAKALKGLCLQTFHRSQVCLGLEAKLDATVRCEPYPVERFFSDRCSKISPNSSSSSMCPACSDISCKAAVEDEVAEIKIEQTYPDPAEEDETGPEEHDLKVEVLEDKSDVVSSVDPDADDPSKVVLGEEDGFSCDMCGQHYKHIGSLLRHEKRVHGKETVKPPRIRKRTHVCEFCQKGFDNKMLCLEHRTSHTGEKLFHCEECGKGFGFLSNYNYHIQAHLRQKGMVTDDRNNSLYHYCEHCGKEFSNKQVMRRHIDVHHKNKSLKTKCDQCGEMCNNAGHLLSHMNKCHRSDNRYQCGTCGKRFGGKKSLDRHELVHKEPQLECKFCGKKVKKLENLLNHERIHTGETPFRCLICQFSFRSRPALSLHKRTHSKTEARSSQETV